MSFVLALCCLSVDASAVPPANDTCANAILVTCGTTVTGSTTDATIDGAPTCVVLDTAPGVWYKIVGTGENITLHTTNAATNFDTQLSVYSGTCGALTCITGNDEGGPNGTSRLTWATTVGTTYLVLVHGNGANKGNFALAILCSSGQPGTLCASTHSLDGGRLLTLNTTTGAARSSLISPG